jgi:hypothetical protein
MRIKLFFAIALGAGLGFLYWYFRAAIVGRYDRHL